MLTETQHKALMFIRDFIDRQGYAPSLAEIGAALGIGSRGTVHRHVQALAEAGRIELVPGRKRGIRLPDEAGDACSLPLAGRIAAGRPIEAIPDQEHLNLADFLLGPDRFALQVVGDSMMEAGILDGDTVVVERRERARNGEIVVALVDGSDVTLKRIEQRPDCIVLYPANAAMEPLRLRPEQVEIQGVLIAQMRRY